MEILCVLNDLYKAASGFQGQALEIDGRGIEVAKYK